MEWLAERYKAKNLKATKLYPLKYCSPGTWSSKALEAVVCEAPTSTRAPSGIQYLEQPPNENSIRPWHSPFFIRTLDKPQGGFQMKGGNFLTTKRTQGMSEKFTESILWTSSSSLKGMADKDKPGELREAAISLLQPPPSPWPLIVTII